MTLGVNRPDPSRDPLITWVTFRFGTWYGRFSRTVVRGFEMSSLDGVRRGQFRDLGVNSCPGVTTLGFQMGTAQGIYPWVITLVMGNLMGRRFWVGRGCFSWGDGEGREMGITQGE